MSKDIIRWVIDCMISHDDSITQELALTVEREARAEWGGREEYIHKAIHGDRRGGRRPLPPDADRTAYEAGLSAAPTDRVLQDHGISRATLYRRMKDGGGGRFS